MKALTVKPEFARLIMSGEKRIENRSWGKSVRGDIAIHRGGAGGAVLGVVAVVDVLSAGDASARYPEQSEYIHGPLCWVLDNPRPLQNPIPCKGRLSLWDCLAL